MSHWNQVIDDVPGVSSPHYLVDTSAIARLSHHQGVSEVLEPLLLEGQATCCDVTMLEMGLTAKGAIDHQSLMDALKRLPAMSLHHDDFSRAAEVQGELAARGQHRGVAIPDLLVAACAERTGMTVIHCDADFDLIAAVTGQPMIWVIDRDQL